MIDLEDITKCVQCKKEMDVSNDAMYLLDWNRGMRMFCSEECRGKWEAEQTNKPLDRL